MANEIQTKLDAVSGVTVTLASLADGNARASAAKTNTNNRPAGLLQCLVTTGTGPTDGTIVEIYLLRDNGSGIETDGWGGTDAAITIENASLLGTLVSDGSNNQGMEEQFDTAPLGPLGDEYGYAFKNETGAALNATGGNHSIEEQLYLPEIQ